MYIEENYIVDQFINNFLNKNSHPIIIYGTGLNTQRLLERVTDGRIVGLMDAKRTGEILWGYRVLSYQEVAGIKNCIIVVIARNAVINVIYRRIEGFCKEHDISVYDIQGHDLGATSREGKEHPCFMQKEGKLKDAIAEHDIISFDIFDTLLMRRIMRPRDIFFVMDLQLKGKNYHFSKERIKAEDTYPAGSNPTIAMIYDEFQKNTGITLEEREFLINLEVGTEKNFLVKRKRMCELYHWSLEQDKKVYLISDMYFSKEILEELLKSFDITGYQDVLVSCEYRKGKQGGLFEEYKTILEKDENNLKLQKCLHIGDNYYSDVLAARTAGIDSFQIYSASEMFEYSVYSKSLQNCNSLEENIALSCFMETAYNNPFRECKMDGKLVIEDVEELTELFIAPVIYKYVIWLVQNIQKNGNDFLLFPSRDGYLLQKIYEKIKVRSSNENLPDAEYFYTSRRSAMTAAVKDESDIKRIADFIFVQDKISLFKERFGLDISDRPEVEKYSMEQLLEQYMGTILKNCKVESENYRSYLESFSLEKYKNIAFTDFVAMGTVQEALERFMGRPLEGYYFLKRKGDRKALEELKCYSLYEEAGDFQISANIYRFYYFLETIITSYEPTFWGIASDGTKTFYQEKRSDDTINLLKRIHNEILNYADLMLNLLPDINTAVSGIELFDGLLGYFSADYSELGTDELNQLINIDEFMGKNVVELNR